jgi:deoxycytidylate deaminase
LNRYTKSDLLELVEDIIDLDTKMRFAAIIDKKGNVIESIMKSGKTSLKTQKEEEHFCKQVSQRRKMRHEFDKHLGKVRYVHVEREKVTQLVVYTKNKTIYFTVEPELSINKKLRIVMKIKKMAFHL